MRLTIDNSLWTRFKRIFTHKTYFKIHISNEELHNAFKSEENLESLCNEITDKVDLETQKHYISQRIKK